MGVHGLWKLLEPAGKAVALESLQNKVLGVDVSIWLHQAMKGFQDRKGSPLPNAHLLGIFHRVCKLLFYRIKPVFVFDGGVPVLKKNTIAARRKFKGQAARDAKHVAEQLLKNLVKHKAVRKVLGEKASKSTVSEDRPRRDENLFELPPMLNDSNDFQSLSSDSEASVKYEHSGEESDSDQDVKYLSPSKIYAMNLDLHTLDVSSENFRSLPADVRHDILSDLKETRKQNSWGRVHEMPKESTDFSSFQLNRLLKRRSVQVSLEEAEKEMGGKVLSMAELEDIMSAQGVKLEDSVASSKEAQLNAYSKRIASDVATRFLLVSESSKNKEPTGVDLADTEKELKEITKEKDVKIKQEHQDDWSSDESVKEMKMETKLDDKIKIKQEYEDDWSSDDEARKMAVNENLAEQFITDKDSLSQAEILALIQNEKSRHAADKHIPADVPRNSKAAGIARSTTEPSTSGSAGVVLNTTKAGITEPSSSRSAGVVLNTTKAGITEPSSSRSAGVVLSTTKAGITEPSTSEDALERVTSRSADDVLSTIEAGITESGTRKDALKLITSKTDFVDVSTGNIPPTKYKGRDSPVTVKSDSSDDDFDEVATVEPELIERVISVKQPDQVKNLNIEVVINKDERYKPEDDLFADIFPAGEVPKEVLQLTPKKIMAPSEKTVPINVKEKEITSTKIGELQERVEKFVNEKVEIEQKKAQKTPDKVVNGEDKSTNLVGISEGDLEDRRAENKRLSKEFQVPLMSSEELKSLESELEDKHEELLAEKGRQERLAASITDQMCAEAQELLRLFGVPFVVAPMEAEAQCALLDSLSLTEGTITDDSDIWLFGGNKVYKNFFNQKKHVLQYTSTTIQHYLKLGRSHMILLALLVGSDYTTGLQGIGPVTAMEVLAAFPPGKMEITVENRETMIEGLRRFRDWWQAGRPHRSAATQHLRNKVKDLQFYEGFPSLAVVDAYLRPAVDESKERFSWGDLDLQGLREFARMKFGWAQAKADEILLPVAKRVDERKSQRFIDSYFNSIPQYNEGEKKMSKRVKRAVRRMDNEEEGDSEDADDPEPKQSQKRSASQNSTVRKKRVQENDEAASGEEGETATRPRKKSTAPRKTVKRVKEPDTCGDDDAPEPKKGKASRTVIKAIPEDEGESSTSKDNDLPKPRPRQRTSTGVIRSGTKEPSNNINSVEGKSTEPVEKTAAKKVNQPRKKATGNSTEPVESTTAEAKKALTKIATQPRKKTTNMEENLGSINEGEETPLPVVIPSDEPKPGPSSQVLFEPKPGSSKDQPEDPEEEEEAILAALHAMDWDDDPWGGFEPPREKLFFGGVRKNPTKPRRPPQPQPLPPPPPTQRIDTRGYRPGSLTLDRIESRVTQPHLEWSTPSNKIPQKEKDRQQAEDSKMKAIKLFKAAGAMKTSKLLGEDPANSRRKPKKKKPMAKVKELNLSEGSSSDD